MTPNQRKMYRHLSETGLTRLSFKPPTYERRVYSDNVNALALSPQSQSSTAVRSSSSSQDPIFTRSELVNVMHNISAFALHYSSTYFSIGSSYHALPFSARISQWVVQDMRAKAENALNASSYRQLPDLVYVFAELSYRLNESQLLLNSEKGDWQASERQLRRCDMLLQEAELRLRFVQCAVWNMWWTVGRDEKVSWDEGEDKERTRAAFEKRWLSVLPQICFNGRQHDAVAEEGEEGNGRQRKWDEERY